MVLVMKSFEGDKKYLVFDPVLSRHLCRSCQTERFVSVTKRAAVFADFVIVQNNMGETIQEVDAEVNLTYKWDVDRCFTYHPMTDRCIPQICMYVATFSDYGAQVITVRWDNVMYTATDVLCC